MQLNTNIGKIFDTVRYFDIYFNRESITEYMELHNLEVASGLAFFHKVGQIIVDRDLMAFFYFKENRISLLDRFFLVQISNMHTIGNFVELLSQKGCLERELMAYYLGIKDSMQSACCNALLYDAELDANVKMSLFIALHYPEVILEKLKEAILTVYDAVSQLHEAHSPLITGFHLETMYLEIIREQYRDVIDRNSIYGVSLLNPYAIKFGADAHNKHIWIFGHLCKRTLENDFQYLHVTPKSVGALFSHEYKTDIMDIILEHKRINPAEITRFLSQKYNISSASVYRVINELLETKAVIVVEKTSKNVYYALNKQFFENAQVAMNKALLYYIENIADIADSI